MYDVIMVLDRVPIRKSLSQYQYVTSPGRLPGAVSEPCECYPGSFSPLPGESCLFLWDMMEIDWLGDPRWSMTKHEQTPSSTIMVSVFICRNKWNSIKIQYHLDRPIINIIQEANNTQQKTFVLNKMQLVLDKSSEVFHRLKKGRQTHPKS